VVSFILYLLPFFNNLTSCVSKKSASTFLGNFYFLIKLGISMFTEERSFGGSMVAATSAENMTHHRLGLTAKPQRSEEEANPKDWRWRFWVLPLVTAAVLRLLGVEPIVIRLQGGIPPTSFVFRLDGLGIVLLALSIVGLIWLIVVRMRAKRPQL
jgi:hypothetical protein